MAISPMGNFLNFHKREDEILNEDSLDRQFGQSDVYDSSDVILNRNRDPSSRVRDMNNATDGKGTRRKGQWK